MKERICLLTVAVALFALIPGCRQESRGMMSAIPPPEGWVQAIGEMRAAKDDNFRADPETPLLPEDVAGFEGLAYWPADRNYYFVGRVNLYFEPEKFTIISSSGRERPCEKAGWVGFELDGQRLTLQVYRLLDREPEPGSTGFFLPFMDGTTGQESYPAGRYVDLIGPRGGPYVLDFNGAYNPLCAYGSPERYVCPVTPSENRLPVRIEAGERGYKKNEPGRSG
jgi:uncharacterized protein (DUF1684 family)